MPTDRPAFGGTPSTALPILMALAIGGGVALFTRNIGYTLAVVGLYGLGAVVGWALTRRRRAT